MDNRTDNKPSLMRRMPAAVVLAATGMLSVNACANPPAEIRVPKLICDLKGSQNFMFDSGDTIDNAIARVGGIHGAPEANDCYPAVKDAVQSEINQVEQAGPNADALPQPGHAYQIPAQVVESHQ